MTQARGDGRGRLHVKAHDTIHTDRSGSGMAPRLSKWDLRVPYDYQGKGRRQQQMQQQERDLLQAVTRRADQLALRWYHPGDPRQDKRGFPDLTIAGPEGFVIWELKSQTGRSSIDQTRWASLLRDGRYLGHMVIRPDDWGRDTLPYLLLDQIAGL